MPEGNIQGGQGNQQQLMQVIQQKMGNMEISLNALIETLVEKEIVEEEEINEKAQEIVQNIQDQQEQMQQAQEEE
ncbi:MAG: hypothetical protein MUP58_00950 [Candidatus Nanohaloarchaeota archaeon QJJ-9]|nr:hypothetical protein [Candidatus Nanohaloarchaeota archaeon QJJ-9]